MSNMNGNPHSDNANNLVSAFHGYKPLDLTVKAAVMQAEATLALAYEQRTANLIAAYETMIPKHYGEPIPKAQRPIILKIRDDINERLGHNQEANKLGRDSTND